MLHLHYSGITYLFDLGYETNYSYLCLKYAFVAGTFDEGCRENED